MITRITSHKTIREFTKFVIVGTFNTLLDFSVFLLLTRIALLYFMYANVIALLISMTSSFILNKFWTFKNFERKVKKQYVQFIAVNAVYFILNNGIVWISVTRIGLEPVWAKVIAVGIGLFWNFGANKMWTFKRGDMVGEVQRSIKS